MFIVACRNCRRAFKAGTQVDVTKCEGCPWFESVQFAENAWLEAQQDQDIEPNDHHWLECEAVNAEWRAEQQAREDEARSVAQQSAEREPVRQQSKTWPGLVVRKAQKGRRNG